MTFSSFHAAQRRPPCDVFDARLKVIIADRRQRPHGHGRASLSDYAIFSAHVPASQRRRRLSQSNRAQKVLNWFSFKIGRRRRARSISAFSLAHGPGYFEIIADDAKCAAQCTVPRLLLLRPIVRPMGFWSITIYDFVTLRDAGRPDVG